MPSERIQREIDSLLDQAHAAVGESDWAAVRDRAQKALAFDPDNEDAQGYLAAAARMLGSAPNPPPPSLVGKGETDPLPPPVRPRLPPRSGEGPVRRRRTRQRSVPRSLPPHDPPWAQRAAPLRTRSRCPCLLSAACCQLPLSTAATRSVARTMPVPEAYSEAPVPTSMPAPLFTPLEIEAKEGFVLKPVRSMPSQ